MTSAVDALLERAAFDYGADLDGLFAEAMREAFSIHFRGCPEFRAYASLRGFPDASVPDDFELEALPFIFVNVFKSRDMITGSRDAVVLELTSSGTGGRRSRNFLDQISLDRVKTIARNVYDGLDMVAPEQKVNYVFFSYDPRVAKDLGTAFTDELLQSFTDVGEAYYSIRWDEKLADFRFDLDGTIEAIECMARLGQPLRFLGFPAFLHKILLERRRRGMPALELGNSSWALTGGGWKTHEGEAIARDEFARQCENELGFPAGNVRDLFGMVEHGVPYVQCELGSFHVPVYGRLIIRHPLTLEPLPDGEVGLMQLMTPYFTSYPAISILTSDLAKRMPPCPCGRKGPTLEIVGRGGVTKHKGCAIQAVETLLREQSAGGNNDG